MGTPTPGTVQFSCTPVDACTISFVKSASVGRDGPSQFKSNAPDPTSKKLAASVLAPRCMRYSAFAAPTRSAPAGVAEYFVSPPGETEDTTASGPSSPGRKPLTKSSPANRRG